MLRGKELNLLPRPYESREITDSPPRANIIAFYEDKSNILKEMSGP